MGLLTTPPDLRIGGPLFGAEKRGMSASYMSLFLEGRKRRQNGRSPHC